MQTTRLQTTIGLQILVLLFTVGCLQSVGMAQPAPKWQEVSLYNKDKEQEICIELNQRVRTRQLAGGFPDFQPEQTAHGVVFWNPKVYAYATTWYSQTLHKIRVLSQILSFFRDSAAAKGEKLDGPIPVIAYAQRNKIINPDLAQQYTRESGEFQIYFNSNKSSFDSLAHPMPWPDRRQQ